MKSYPIWMDVTSCIYKSSKSYGVKNDGHTEIYVGSGSRNSHHFATINMTHRDLGERGKSFRLYVDGNLIKEGIVKDGELSLLDPYHRYEVRHYTLSEGWKNTWQENDKPQSFPTVTAAQSELDEFLNDIHAEIATGQRSLHEGYNSDEFRIYDRLTAKFVG